MDTLASRDDNNNNGSLEPNYAVGRVVPVRVQLIAVQKQRVHTPQGPAKPVPGVAVATAAAAANQSIYTEDRLTPIDHRIGWELDWQGGRKGGQ